MPGHTARKWWGGAIYTVGLLGNTDSPAVRPLSRAECDQGSEVTPWGGGWAFACSCPMGGGALLSDRVPLPSQLPLCRQVSRGLQDSRWRTWPRGCSAGPRKSLPRRATEAAP